MNTTCRLLASLAIFAAPFVAAVPANAQAVIRDCTTLGTWSLRNDGNAVTVNVEAGDTVNVAVEDFVGLVEVVVNAAVSVRAQPFAITATTAGSITLIQNAGGALITCIRPTAAGGTTLGNDLGALSGNSQTTAAQDGVSRNTQNRLGAGGANTASRNALFFSTQGASNTIGTSDYNA